MGAAQAAPAGQTTTAARPGPQTTPGSEAACSGAFHGDARLGPSHLPASWERPVGPLLTGYHRTGGLAPSTFLAKYWDSTHDSWTYPPHDGFALRPDHSVDKQVTRLAAGQQLDRFGSEYGSFLAPAGDRYAQRSLPPQSLTTRDSTHPCGYHLYRVTKPFKVWQGSIAPWFEQPGGGEQILLDATFLPPGQGQKLNVKWLLTHHYLKAEKTSAVAPAAAAGQR